MSTVGAANTQGWSRATQRQRSRWSDPCSSLIIDFFSTSIQTTLLVLFLPVFRDELAHVTLQAGIISIGAGCLLWRIYNTYKRSRELQSNRLPQAVSVSQGFEVGETQIGWHQRFGILILKWLVRSLDVFFPLWSAVGVGIIYTGWVTGQTPHLNWLCTVLFVIAYLPFVLVPAVYTMIFIWRGIRGAKANVIWALSTYKFHAQVSDLETNRAKNKEDDDVKGVSIGGDEQVRVPAATAADQVDQVACCVCLDPCEDGVELKLPCTHHFHVKCVDRWLKINDSCPICKSEVRSTSVSEVQDRPSPGYKEDGEAQQHVI